MSAKPGYDPKKADVVAAGDGDCPRTGYDPFVRARRASPAATGVDAMGRLGGAPVTIQQGERDTKETP